MNYIHQDELDDYLKEQFELWEAEQRFRFAFEQPARRREFEREFEAKEATPDEDDWHDAEAEAWGRFLEEANWPSEAVRLTMAFEPRDA